MKKNSSEKIPTKRMTQEERAAVEQIAKENQHLIRHTVQKILGQEHRDLVEDCIQTVLLTICEQIDVLRQHMNPIGWIVKTSKNVAYNAIHARKMSGFDETLDETVTADPSQDIVDEVLYDDWVKNDVKEQLLSRLSKREKEVYTLLYIQKLTSTEAAEELHISVSTVRNIHKNLRDRIKTDIKEHNFKGL